MTQEDKELLLKDLSARLPYGVILDYSFIADNKKRIHTQRPLTYRNIGTIAIDEWHTNEELFKPYLRPMSSMTEEEKEDWYKESHVDYDCEFHPTPTLSLEYCHLSTDWLNAHFFDYRGLIEKGLALEALEGMYNIKKQ